MTERIQIKTDKASISEYIQDFERGNLQVPAFQRAFVWNNEKKLELFDSIKKGIPNRFTFIMESSVQLG
jgi:uncharacterized protein with ParB-like and HNH nuclease domain